MLNSKLQRHFSGVRETAGFRESPAEDCWLNLFLKYLLIKAAMTDAGIANVIT